MTTLIKDTVENLVLHTCRLYCAGCSDQSMFDLRAMVEPCTLIPAARWYYARVGIGYCCQTCGHAFVEAHAATAANHPISCFSDDWNYYVLSNELEPVSTALYAGTEPGLKPSLWVSNDGTRSSVGYRGPMWSNHVVTHLATTENVYPYFLH